MAKSNDIFGFLGGDVKTKIFSIVIIVLILFLLVWGGKKIAVMIKGAKLSLDASLSSEPASYSSSQYSTFADTLYGAMKGLSTDTTAVYGVFNSMKNKTDVLKLIAAFGVRDGETLAQWMAGEWRLNMDTINKTLQTKGIDYQF
jgi:hypothetical protein